MPKLTDTQLVILSAAAGRDDGSVLPLPKTLKVNRGAVAVVLNSLLKRKLIAERAAKPREAVWRTEDERRLTLTLTRAGLDSIGVTAEEECQEPTTTAPSRVASPSKRQKPAAARGRAAMPSEPRPGSKLDVLVALLRRQKGATIDELAAKTGWQKHSVRGAISGALKKKMGLVVQSETIDGRGRIYRIVEATNAK